MKDVSSCPKVILETNAKEINQVKLGGQSLVPHIFANITFLLLHIF